MCMQDDIKDISNENGGCGIDARPLVCIIGAGNVATAMRIIMWSQSMMIR